MRRRTVAQLVFVGLAGFYFCAANASAQSSHYYYSCSSAPGAFGDGGILISRRNPHSPRIYIDSLTFDGPIHLSATSLKQLLTTVKENKFSTDFTSPKEIEDWLQKPWRDEGYFKVNVSVEAKPVGSGDDGRYSITAHVDEGLQYRLGLVEFRADSDPDSDDYGTPGKPLPRRKASSEETPDSIELASRPVFPREELRKLIPLQEGDIFSAEKVREGLDALNRLYGAHGYIDFVAAPDTEIDDEHQTVSIRFELVEEKQYRIGKIEVYGLDASRQNALIWKIKTGDVINNEALQAFFDANQPNFPAGSYYAEAPEIVRHPKTGTVDVEFTFKSCFGR
jgi:Surface antigen variable number repeat